MRPRFIIRRDGKMLFLFNPWSSLGLTLWRRGALALQFRGHFAQFVLGDWWKTMP